MGIDMKHFRGGHAFRRFYITGMANNPHIPLAESMKAARHSSVAAHVAYMQGSAHTERARMEHLLKRNAPSDSKHKPDAKKLKPSQRSMSQACAIHQEKKPPIIDVSDNERPSPHGQHPQTSFETLSQPHEVFNTSPANTQEEFKAFQEECAMAEAMAEPSKLSSKPHQYSGPFADITNTHQQENTYAFSNPDKKNSAETVRLAQDRFAQIANSTNRRRSTGSYTKVEFNPYTRKPLWNPYTNQAFRSVPMSREQQEIRKLRMKLREVETELSEQMNRNYELEEQEVNRRASWGYGNVQAEEYMKHNNYYGKGETEIITTCEWYHWGQ